MDYTAIAQFLANKIILTSIRKSSNFRRCGSTDESWAISLRLILKLLFFQCMGCHKTGRFVEGRFCLEAIFQPRLDSHATPSFLLNIWRVLVANTLRRRRPIVEWAHGRSYKLTGPCCVALERRLDTGRYKL